MFEQYECVCATEERLVIRMTREQHVDAVRKAAKLARRCTYRPKHVVILKQCMGLNDRSVELFNQVLVRSTQSLITSLAGTIETLAVPAVCGLSVLAVARSLRRLRVDALGNRQSESLFRLLPRLPSLEELSIRYDIISDETLAGILYALPLNLQTLRLTGAFVHRRSRCPGLLERAARVCFNRMPALRKLDLCQMTWSALRVDPPATPCFQTIAMIDGMRLPDTLQHLALVSLLRVGAAPPFPTVQLLGLRALTSLDLSDYDDRAGSLCDDLLPLIRKGRLRRLRVRPYLLGDARDKLPVLMRDVSVCCRELEALDCLHSDPTVLQCLAHAFVLPSGCSSLSIVPDGWADEGGRLAWAVANHPGPWRRLGIHAYHAQVLDDPPGPAPLRRSFARPMLHEFDQEQFRDEFGLDEREAGPARLSQIPLLPRPLSQELMGTGLLELLAAPGSARVFGLRVHCDRACLSELSRVLDEQYELSELSFTLSAAASETAAGVGDFAGAVARHRHLTALRITTDDGVFLRRELFGAVRCAAARGDAVARQDDRDVASWRVVCAGMVRRRPPGSSACHAVPWHFYDVRAAMEAFISAQKRPLILRFCP
jgi:hypothetical protein